MDSFTVKLSDRSMRRVQITLAAMQTADQTARAVAEAANSMVAQARKSLDEALGAICDAHDQQLPEEYSISLRVNDGEITINDVQPAQGSLLYPPQQGMPLDMLNGTHPPSLAPEASPSTPESPPS
jgi:hypothetical protein